MTERQFKLLQYLQRIPIYQTKLAKLNRFYITKENDCLSTIMQMKERGKRK